MEDNSPILSLEHSLQLVPIRELMQTEEIVAPRKLEELANFMLDQGTFPNPIIAARNPHTKKILPLDGNHRHSAGILCGLHYLPVLFVDWDEFGIDAWNRAVNITNSKQLEELLSRFNLKECKLPVNSNCAVLYYGGKTYIFDGVQKSKLRQHQITKDFFETLSWSGVQIVNIVKAKAETDELKKDPSILVVELPKFSKNELIKIIEAGTVLPPKAYRTILPHGPIRLPVRMNFLQELKAVGQKQLEKINERWTEELRQVHFVQLPCEINVSQNPEKFYAGLKVAPFVVNPYPRFEILDEKELEQLNPLNLRHSIVKIIDLPENFQKRLESLKKILGITVNTVKEAGKSDRIYFEGPAMMCMETVFELCFSDTPVDEGSSRILSDQEKISDAIIHSKSSFPRVEPGEFVPVPSTKAEMIHGACLCGKVAFEMEGVFESFRYCHCSRCQKVTGSAHASNLFIKPKYFRWIRGEEHVHRYDVPEAERFSVCFCRFCGSPCPRITRTGDMFVIPAGSLEKHPEIFPVCSIFWDSRAPWYHSIDELPQFKEYPE
ncbi:MAG: GFA family protein [SAR324 cluster bacterium]|nr:GFA family protein [SAR324 cluster bacterium]